MIRTKIVGWPALGRHLKRERSKGRRIVFTNGVFDILHAGHLKVLEWSKRQGDVLVVGLNSDASVRRLKGPTRPIVPQGERALMMAGLVPVDYVTLFSDDTPAKLIRMIKPDVLVKGGDWKPEAIVGAAEVKAWGGSVHSIPFRHQLSTTALLAKIRRP